MDDEADESKGEEGLVVDRLEEDPSSSELSLFGAWTLKQVGVSDRCKRHKAQREGRIDEHTPVSFASVAALGPEHSPLSSLLLSLHVQRHYRGWRNDMCSPLCGPSSDCMAISGRTKVRERSQCECIIPLSGSMEILHQLR